jgi:iron complex transport system ATP-binding protein
MIEGLAVWIGPEAVVLTGSQPLSVLSSAVWGGGLVSARAIVNLHVALDDPCTDPSAMFGAYARAQSVPEPYVGLLTGAWTERATVGEESGAGIRTLAVATVGLSNRVAAGRAPVTQWTHGTINTIVVVDADPEPAALVNAVMTVTEVKALLLNEAGVRDAAGGAVSGTSSDAIVIAATGRGPRVQFGGPVSEMGWSIARAAGTALDAGIQGWLERNR